MARMESATVRLAQAQREARTLAERARLEAERIARVSAERTPGLVEEVVRRVFALGEPTAGAAPGPATTLSP